MVGPESVVSSADDDVEQRQRDDYDETTTTTLSDHVAELDIVQLLTRRLSVTPPTTLEHGHMTASTSTEVDSHFSLPRSLSLPLCIFLSCFIGGRHLRPASVLFWRLLLPA